MADNTELMNEENEITPVSGFVNEENSNIDLKKYINYLVIGIVVILVVAGGYYYNNYRIAEQNIAAQKEYDKIEELLKTEDYDKALNGGMTSGGKAIGLLALVNNYGSTELSNTAALHAGFILLEKNQTSKAKEMFEKAMSSESEVVKMGGNAGMGASFENDKNHIEAAKYYEIAAGLTTQKTTSGKYKYFAALNYELAKNKEKSIELYKDLINEDQFSEFAGLSKIALVKLGIDFD